MEEIYTVALAGNPNSGKTTVFNQLTGARQHVGNYPGVTVEKREGTCHHKGATLRIVDLPGTYSLTAYSTEERVARSFIVEERPDVVLDIVDASNLERNLYLTTQLIELGAPLGLVFNMSDVAEARGFEIDDAQLSMLLGAPVVRTVGHKGTGMDALLDMALDAARNPAPAAPNRVRYGREIEEELDKVEAALARSEPDLCVRYGARWLALKLLERDAGAGTLVHDSGTRATVERSIDHLRLVFGDDPEIVIADRRYGFISGACQEAVRSSVEVRHNFSDKVDAVLAHQMIGFPIFLALMYLTYYATFALGEPATRAIEWAFGQAAAGVASFWPKGSESAVKSLLVDGVIGGVGGVLAFLPNILLLFMAIALLEDTGYMARAAFLMDRLMHRIGLHGKSFIPMVIGFGCSVPAIMATRILENRRDRMTTILVIPLMSCSARLTIYALIVPAFFAPELRAAVLWSVYLIGILLAVAAAKLLRVSLFRGESTPFVMELPPYRVPTLKGALIHMWERGRLYVRKAGTVILAFSIVLWVLTTYPRKARYDRDYEGAARVARETYLDGMARLDGPLGLPEGSRTLRHLAETELAFEDAGARFCPNDPEFAEAERARTEAIARLEKGLEGEAVHRFLATRDEVAAARGELSEEAEASGLQKGSTEYRLLMHEHNATLTVIEKDEPRAYAAAVVYLDEVRAPYEEAVARLEHERRAEALAYSFAGRIGRALEPPLRLAGFDWKIATALIGAFAAKEVFVAQLSIVYSVGDEGAEGSATLRTRLREHYSPLVGFCIMLFCLVGLPCMATVAMTWRETGSWRWAAFQLVALTLLAYALSVLVYQAGRLGGLAG